jgi:hypothetical protein
MEFLFHTDLLSLSLFLLVFFSHRQLLFSFLWVFRAYRYSMVFFVCLLILGFRCILIRLAILVFRQPYVFLASSLSDGILVPFKEQCVQSPPDFFTVVVLQSTKVYKLFQKQLLILVQLHFVESLQRSLDSSVALQRILLTCFTFCNLVLFSCGCFSVKHPLASADCHLDFLLFPFLNIIKFFLLIFVLVVELRGQLLAPVDAHLVLLSVVLGLSLLLGLPALCLIFFLGKVPERHQLEVVGLHRPLVDHTHELDASLFLSGEVPVALE